LGGVQPPEAVRGAAYGLRWISNATPVTGQLDGAGMRALHSTIIAGLIAAVVGLPSLVYAASVPEPQESGAAEAQPPAELSSVEPPAAAIPPGTTITKSNWRQYQQFFTQGEIGFWEGKWFWKMPDDVQINVGPTEVYPLPEPFIELSEKYGDQTQLVRLPDGRWRVKNYIAGIPFPIPHDPDMGLKILADLNYRITPHLIAGFIDSGTTGSICEIDRFYNKSCTQVDYDFRQMAYNWEPGVPRVEPDSGQAWLGEWVQVEEPEQARYTADLVLLWQDNLRPEGHWAFLPALRRSIPLADYSHCESLLSSRDHSYGYADTSWPGRVNDLQGDYDAARGWIEPVSGAVPDAVMHNYAGGVQTTSPQNLIIMHGGWIGGIGDYDVTSVKRQQLLALTQLNFEYGRFPDNYDMPLGWAKPSWGAWELRNVWVIEVRPIPLIANQCKGKRLIYVDRSLSAPLAEDLYDGNMNLSKVMVISSQPKSVAEYGMQTWAGGGILQLWDVAGEHAVMSLTADARGRTWSIDGAVKPQYNNIAEFQTPGGLMRLMR
jgi:Protein of unknown function (DUF1329)